MVMFNHDLILGEVAHKLKAQTDTLVDNVAFVNTTISTLDILVFSAFCIFAEQDYLRYVIENPKKDLPEPSPQSMEEDQDEPTATL